MEKVFGLEIPENLEEACELNRTALVVYDMQVGIFSQLSNGAEIKSQVVKVLQVAREVGLRIFFMRHMSLPNELSGIFQLRTAKAWQRATSVADVKPWFLRDSPGFQLIPDCNHCGRGDRNRH
jgi:biuret amidohydrolase